MDWDKLITERDVWVAHNFPNPSRPGPGESIWGCVEELGELTHAHLKEKQSIRGTSEEHQAEAKDAIADLTIYLLGVMSSKSLVPVPPTLSSHRKPKNADEALDWLSFEVGRLSQCYALDMTFTYQRVVNNLVYYLRQYCLYRGWEYEEIVTKEWDRVKTRDWIAYPSTGMPPETAQVKGYANGGNDPVIHST